MNSPNSRREPESRKARRRFWIGAGLSLGVVTVLGLAGGAWWAWIYVHKRLSPTISELLTEFLERPVELGQVERVTLHSIKVGPSAIPATQTDPDEVFIESIEVKFNLLRVLLTGKFRLNLDLIGVKGYFEQNQAGDWLDTKIELPEPPDPPPYFEIKPGTFQLQSGQLVLAPYAESGSESIPFSLQEIDGKVSFHDQTIAGQNRQQLDIEVQGESISGGSLKALGEALLPAGDDHDQSSAPASSDTASPDSAPEEASLSAGGELEANLNLRIQNLSLVEIAPVAIASTPLKQLPVDLQSGEINGVLDISIRPEQPIDLRGTARVSDASLTTDVLSQPVENINGQLRFNQSLITLENLVADYEDLSATGEGSIHLEDGYELVGRVNSITIDQAVAAVGQTTPFLAEGNYGAEVRIQGPFNQPKLMGRVNSLDTVLIDKVEFADVSLDFSLLSRDSISLDRILAIPPAGGEIVGQGWFKFAEGQELFVEAEGRELPGDAIGQVYGLPPQIAIGRVAGEATVSGPLNNLQTLVAWRAPEAIFPGQGEVEVTFADRVVTLRNTVLQVAGGTVSAAGVIAQGVWNMDLQGRDVELSQFAPNLSGLASADLQLSGSLEDFSFAGVRGQGDITLVQGLASLSPQFANLNQPLNASLRWDGQQIEVQQATAAGIYANGFITPQLEGEGAPNIAALDLNVSVQDYALAASPFALPNAIAVGGTGSFTGRVTGAPSAPNLAGSLQLAGLTVNNLMFDPLLAGDVQFSLDQGFNLALLGQPGGIAGQPDQIIVNYQPGDPAQADSSLGSLAFRIGLDEALALGRTEQDQLRVHVRDFPLTALNPSPQGIPGLGAIGGIAQASFDINLAKITAVGDILIQRPSIGFIAADEFSGQISYIDGAAARIGGRLVRGESEYFATARYNPGLDPELLGQIRVEQGKVQDVLEALQIYELQDFARGFSPPSWSDTLSPAELNARLATTPAGLPEAPLLDQLRRLAEIQAQQDIAAAEAEAAPIPPLNKLAGEFDGDIQLAWSSQSGPSADFNLQGQGWRWGDDFRADQVIASGNFTNGLLTLTPIRLESAPAGPDQVFLELSGSVAAAQIEDETLALNLKVQNLPVGPLQEILNLPLAFGGELNGSATLTGNLGDPQVRGALTLADGSINETPIQAADAQFLYKDARLYLRSELIAQTPEPLSLAVIVPYAFGFMTVTPESDEIFADINVRDDGLALLNLLNLPVAWVSGKGEVGLQASGTWARPIISGQAKFSNTQVKANILPEPLTNVEGQVRFKGERIIVDTLTGQFSQGSIAAKGVFPILFPLDFAASPSINPTAPNVNPSGQNVELDSGPLEAPAEEQPLTVYLNQIALDLKGQYDGRVDGQVVVGGSALQGTRLSGEILLSEGEILLPEGESAASSSRGGVSAPISFRDLRLTLGRNLRIVLGNLLNFVADGQLTINGGLDNLSPEGVIQLKSGRVNIYTTLFRLIGGENTAEFRPNRGLDPELDVTLQATVQDIGQEGAIIQTTTEFPPNEVNDSQIDFLGINEGGSETIRVRARVQGPASQLFDNLSLTSSPPRSENELISLLGGGFISALQSTVEAVSGDGSDFAGLLAVAGNFINDIVGSNFDTLSFRFFSATPASARATGSNVEIGGELGVDISNSLSFSILRVLTTTDSSVLNIRYRMNDQFTLRAITDTDGNNFSEGSGFILEFENRF